MRRFLSLIALCGLSAMLATAATYQVTMDTPTLDGQTGVIDIQFNPGSFPAAYEAGSVTISNFLIVGGLLGAEQVGSRNNATGDLAPGPLVITNGDFLNGIVYDALFGLRINFQVDFTGNAFTAGGQSVLTDFFLNVTAGGSVTAQATLLGDSLLDTTQSSRGVTFMADATTPEPGTFALLGAGSALLFLARKR